MEYNLAKRVGTFSSSLIATLRQIKLTVYNRNIIEQVLRSGTSIGANYQEAAGSVSRNEFKVKIALCKKEAMETLYWLKLLNENCLENHKEFGGLIQESDELVRIFSKALLTLKTRNSAQPKLGSFPDMTVKMQNLS